MTKRVVLSCTPNSVYDFFLPLAIRLWRCLIGYEPIVILVGTYGEWSFGHAKAVLDEVRGESAEFFDRILDLPDSSVSMGLRQNVAALDFDQDDVLLVGDVDLFPVDRDFYHRYDPSKSPVGIYYADMYGGEYWPAYGVSMPVRNWREVMGLTVGDFRGSVERMFLEGKVRELVAAHKADHRDTRFWTFDERYATQKIRESRFSKDVAEFPSAVGDRRPLRVKLPRHPSAAGYIDFHCSRPGWNGENWPDIRTMLDQLLPEHMDWVDRYVRRYRSSL
jgi:hypothetical protein